MHAKELFARFEEHNQGFGVAGIRKFNQSLILPNRNRVSTRHLMLTSHLSLFHAQGKIRHFWLFWKWSISPRADQDPVLLKPAFHFTRPIWSQRNRCLFNSDLCATSRSLWLTCCNASSLFAAKSTSTGSTRHRDQVLRMGRLARGVSWVRATDPVKSESSKQQIRWSIWRQGRTDGLQIGLVAKITLEFGSSLDCPGIDRGCGWGGCCSRFPSPSGRSERSSLTWATHCNAKRKVSS
mmetsp:Transcript_57740/g.126433  ORF Transcript_57740/g.126433 Transcript_57740/m.126433 type:complete len:238 (-) Transcript_57740:180-893(-)